MLLLTGAKGQLGRSLAALLPDAVCAGSDILDIGCADSVKRFVDTHNINKIINCAAYTAVDAAEDNHELAHRVNVTGPSNLAKTGLPVLHFSTDYVFDGQAFRPYDEEAPTHPLSIYAQTKAEGENTLLEHATGAIILRSSWLHSKYGHNFVKTIRKLGAERDSLKVISDQIGTPTYAGHLAKVSVDILGLLQAGTHDIYHYTDAGVCSWYDFAYQIIKKSNLACKIEPIESKDYPSKVKRPYYSVLNTRKIKDTLNINIPHWSEGLDTCLKQF